jgi:hypothetical protein
VIADARKAVRRERRRTVDEREAFETFVRELRRVDTDDAVRIPAGVGRRLADPRPASGTEAVRAVYERTVMGVPHYREEYDDTYAESLEAEFGPELAAAVTENSGLTAGVKRALLRAAREARAERARFVTTLDGEATTLREAATTLRAVFDELDTLREERRDSDDFGAMDAIRARLGVLESKVERIGSDRQAEIRTQREELSLPEGAIDVPTYLYADLSITYPVLSSVARTASLLDDHRRAVERAMTDAA